MNSPAAKSPRHNRIELNLSSWLRRAEHPGCLTLPSGQMISVNHGARYRHADCSIVCGEPTFLDGTLCNPAVLIEVLSDSTEADDRGIKWGEYRRIPSLQDYLLVSQRSVGVDHFQRSGDLWLSLEGYHREEDVIRLTDGATIPVSQIYEGVWGLPGDQ